MKEEKAARVPRILEDDEDQRKQLVRDVATCLKCAERPFVQEARRMRVPMTRAR